MDNSEKSMALRNFRANQHWPSHLVVSSKLILHILRVEQMYEIK